jgi:O-antigen/teichoic acid export membrane protein
VSDESTDEAPAFWKRLLPKSLRRRFQNSPILKRILGNTSWLMFERGVNMTVRFFVGVWLVRYLGPESYGVYSYALSLVGLFAAFATLGLDHIVIRNLTRGRYEEGEIMGTALGLRLCAGVATMAAISAVVLQTQDDPLRQFVVIVVAGKLVFTAADVFDFWFQSKIRSKYVVWVRSSVTLMYAGGQALCILAGFSVRAFAILVTLQALLQVIGTFTAYKIVSEDATRWRIRLGAARDMMRDAWPLIIAGLSIAVYMKIDQVMLGEMKDDATVGIYATAAKISELWYIIPTAIAGSVYPKIVELRESSAPEHYRQRMQDIYDAMAAIAYVIVIPVFLTAEPLIDLLFGESYAESSEVLKVHTWAFLFVAVGVIRGRWLVAENYTRFSMVAALIGAIVNVGLNYFLIPEYAGVGAAWATLLAQVASVLLSCLLWSRLHPVLGQMLKALLVPFRLRSVLTRHFGGDA